MYRRLFRSLGRSVSRDRGHGPSRADAATRLPGGERLEARALLAIDTIAQFGVAVLENFDSMGSGTALPAAFRMIEKNATVSWATGVSTVSQQASSGSPTAGGTYNWGSSASDRAVGAMTSGSWASPNSLLARFTNGTGSTITSLSVGYTAERYRVNTAAASVSFFASTDGLTWTSISDGGIEATNFPTGTSGYTFTAGTTVSRANVVIGSLNVAAGDPFFLRWSLATAGSNSQGIGIDDVSITASGSVASAPSITVSPTALAGPLATTSGTASAPQSFSVSGAALTGNLTVAAPSGLEVSTTANSGYATALELAATSGVVAATSVYVRLAATAAVGSYDGLAIEVSGGGAAAQTVLTSASGNAVTNPMAAVLLAENFATLTAGGNTATTGTGSPSSTEVTTDLTADFPVALKAYAAGGAVKLGTSSLPGSITSRSLNLSGNGGEFTVSFDVKGWTTVEGDITVSVAGLPTQTVSYGATIASAFETKRLQFTGGQAASTITFATTVKRAFLDNITVIGGSESGEVVAPSAPGITGITPASGQLTVAFSPPVSNGGATITNYQYSVDGGMSWVSRVPAVTTSPLVITGLTNGQSYSVRLRAVNSAGPGAASATVTGMPGGIDFLRIVSYNVTAADISGVRTGFEMLVQAMSAESYAGHVDQVDLIAMQEVQSQATTSANLETRLNAIYGAGAYARGSLDGDTTGSGRPGVVFNTAALQLLEERAIGSASVSGDPRQALRYKFQPVGGDASTVFYVYNAHFKAADDSESAARRAAQAQVVRADADALGPGVSILYVGDFNLQTSNEQAYQNLLAPGNGQAFDPVNRPGAWSDNPSFRDIFTQAPSANPVGGFAGGGLDDRYDFQLVSAAVMGSGGLTYKTGSYRTFGNDGSVALNGSINDSGSTALPGLANRRQVLDLLTTVADHLPVVVDYSFISAGDPVSPTIIVSPGTLAAALTATVGTPSAAQSFTVSGAALTGGLTVNPPTGLEVSLVAGSNYAATLTLAATAGTVASTTIYVRLAATAAAGNYNNAGITVSGGGAATQTVRTTASGNAVSEPTAAVLFFEDFAAITAGDNTTTSGSGTAWNGSANWSSVTTAFQAGGAVRLGSGSVGGLITTKSIDLSGNGGVFTVSFDVKGWTSVAGPVTVSVSGLAAETVFYAATMASGFETKTLQFTGGQADSTITFSVAGGQRAFLDNIVVSGGTPVPQVTGITGYLWDDADGDGVWDTPAERGIAGRTVYLDLDRDGVLGPNEPSTVTMEDGRYTFTGLGAGTYIVAQVVPQGWEQTAPRVGDEARTRTLGGVQVATFTDPAYTPVDRQQQKRFVPNDPLFAQQWHLRNTGQQGGTAGQDANVVSAWDVAKGTGVVIAIIDDGVQTDHPDLAAAYRADLSYDFNGNDADPSPGTGDDHGTAVAGVAAARGNNGIGVSGAAPNASISAIRLIAASTTDQQEANGLTYKPQGIDIYSNSWGPTDTGRLLEAPGPLTRAALANAVRTGRGGKGSIYVWAAGNGLDVNDNSNYDGYANSRYTIATTAVDNRGRQSWYAEPGANILVAAPSSGDSSGSDVGIVTTDRTGTAGYNVSASATPSELSDRSYTNDFGGTSSSTPLVSGVVALLLEANPNLGWRDVQHVLANSTRRNDVTDAGWSQNGVGKWVNHKYGFGVVDAAAAVTMAQGWTNVGAEVSAGSGTINVGQTIPDNNAAGITSSFTMGADIRMESVEVVFSATHTSRGHLQVVLTSPAGTRSVLAERRSDTGDHYSAWTFSTVRNWDESSKGTWTLTVSDLTSGSTGTFGSWAVNVYGTSLPAPPGTQAVTVSVGQTVADVNFGSRSTAVPEPPPVKVTGVYVRGSGWAPAYLDLPTFTTVGTDRLGWQLRDGPNQLAGSATVPWSSVNRFSVQFDQAISAPQAAALTLIAATANGTVTITPTAVTLLGGNTVAQFTLSAALATGRYVLSIPATEIADLAGTTVLDGEWDESLDTFAVGSGDGAAGGAFNFAFNVLVGDVVANGTVNGSDRSTASGQMFRALSTANFRSNINGDASINGSDLSLASGQLFRSLGSLASPTFPTASLPAIDSPTSTNLTATGARLGATVTSTGGEPVLERGVVLLAGTTNTPEAHDPAAITLLSAGGVGAFTVDVAGLTPATAYRFRAFVKTSRGTVYTSVGEFTTAAGQIV